MTSFQPKIITHAKKQESVTQSRGVGVVGREQSLETDSQ